MSTTVVTPAIARIVTAQDRWQSNLVEQFERSLDVKIRRAEAKLIATLSQRLTTDSGRLARTPGNVAAMRWLGPAWERQLGREGYGALLTAFVGQFPAQFEFFDSTMRLLKLPKVNWAAKDREIFRTQQLTSIESLQAVVRSVGENAKKRALMSIGGLKLTELTALLQSEYGKTLPQAVGLADTAVSIFYATLSDRGFRQTEGSGIPVRYRYYGPEDAITRPFCERLLAANKTYSREEIERMDNGQIPNVMVSRGGYRCRHQWRPVIDLDDAPPPDPTKKAAEEPVLTKPAPGVPKGRDARTGQEVREELMKRAADLKDAHPIKRAEELRELLYAEKTADVEISLPPGRGERAEFRNMRWSTGLEEFSRLVGSGTVDGKVATFRTNRRPRAHYDTTHKAVTVQADTPFRTIIHELGHWLEDHVPEISRKANAFLQRRTTGETAQSLRSLTGIRGYRAEEKAKPDRFLNPYIGKVYEGGYTEIMSMGLELLWADPEQLMKDPEFFDFIWDVIRG